MEKSRGSGKTQALEDPVLLATLPRAGVHQTVCSVRANVAQGRTFLSNSSVLALSLLIIPWRRRPMQLLSGAGCQGMRRRERDLSLLNTAMEKAGESAGTFLITGESEGEGHWQEGCASYLGCELQLTTTTMTM